MNNRGGKSPIWDEDVHLDIYPHEDNSPRMLRVACFVEGKQVDEKLGEGEIGLDEVLRTGELDSGLNFGQLTGLSNSDI